MVRYARESHLSDQWTVCALIRLAITGASVAERNRDRGRCVRNGVPHDCLQPLRQRSATVANHLYYSKWCWRMGRYL